MKLQPFFVSSILFYYNLKHNTLKEGKKTKHKYQNEMRKINNKENNSHFIIAYNYLGLKTGVIKNYMYFIYFYNKGRSGIIDRRGDEGGC